MTTKFKVDDRVTRSIDVYTPQSGIKKGSIKSIYSRPIEVINPDLILGPYPELYEVRWDDGMIDRGYLPHGLNKGD